MRARPRFLAKCARKPERVCAQPIRVALSACATDIRVHANTSDRQQARALLSRAINDVLAVSSSSRRVAFHVAALLVPLLTAGLKVNEYECTR